jgi:tetratricopeptide (TPR) repeat protein
MNTNQVFLSFPKPIATTPRMYEKWQNNSAKHSKSYDMKTRLSFYCFLLSFALFSCAKTAKTDNTYLRNIEAIPTLLDRNEALIIDTEWANTQSQYGTNRDAAAKKPQEPAAFLKLAEVFIAEARVTGEHGHYYPAALKMVDRALAISTLKDADKFQALALKAGVLLSLHQFANALEVGKAAVALNPHNAHIRGVLVDACVELGKYEEAVEQSDLMMQTRPDLRSYSRVSYLREIHGDVPGAIEALQMAVTSGAPGSEETAWAMLTLGNLLSEYGKKKEARLVYTQILTERKNYPFAMAALANLDIAEGANVLGEAGLEQAIEIIPEVGFYIDLATLYLNTNRKEEAKALVPEILAMLEDDTKAGHQMGMAYAEVLGLLSGDWSAAKSYALLEYQARPENIDVNLLMAKVSIGLNEPNDARKFLETAKRTKSRKPELAELLAAR